MTFWWIVKMGEIRCTVTVISKLFKALDAAVIARNPGWQVMAQVSLGEFLASPDKDTYGAVNAKRVDFALMDPEWWSGWCLANLIYSTVLRQNEPLKVVCAKPCYFLFIQLIGGAEEIKSLIQWCEAFAQKFR